MIIEAERYKGPSKLDERLESYKDADGNIMITAREAASILTRTLFDFYKQAREIEGRTQPTDPRIEALLVVAEPLLFFPSLDEGEKINFTFSLEKIKAYRENREQARIEDDRKIAESHIITPRKPKQPAI